MGRAKLGVAEFTAVPSQPIPEPPLEYLRPDLSDYADADTYFQSKGKITSIFLGDLDFGSFILTVINNTNYRDSGVIAAAAANVDRFIGNNSSGLFLVPHVLEPHSSGESFIHHRNIIHRKIFNDDSRKTGLNAEALIGQVDARVIHLAGAVHRAGSLYGGEGAGRGKEPLHRGAEHPASIPRV